MLCFQRAVCICMHIHAHVCTVWPSHSRRNSRFSSAPGSFHLRREKVLIPHRREGRGEGGRRREEQMTALKRSTGDKSGLRGVCFKWKKTLISWFFFFFSSFLKFGLEEWIYTVAFEVKLKVWILKYTTELKEKVGRWPKVMFRRRRRRRVGWMMLPQYIRSVSFFLSF